jgi:hypothetical protein
MSGMLRKAQGLKNAMMQLEQGFVTFGMGFGDQFALQ